MYQLQKVRQRNLSVEEYRQKMELLMLRSNVKENPNVMIARFQSGLNLEIWDRVELIPFENLDELVHIWVRVEQQLKRKFIFQKNYPDTSFYRRKPRREGYPYKYRYDELKGKYITNNSISSPSEDEVLESNKEIQPCEGELLLVRRLLWN